MATLCSAQAGNTHPCRRIIYVDGRRRARLCGVEERAEHQPVHAVMAAHASARYFFPHRMVVLLTVLPGAVPALGPSLKIILLLPSKKTFVVLHVHALCPRTYGICGIARGKVVSSVRQIVSPLGAFDDGRHHARPGQFMFAAVVVRAHFAADIRAARGLDATEQASACGCRG